MGKQDSDGLMWCDGSKVRSDEIGLKDGQVGTRTQLRTSVSKLNDFGRQELVTHTKQTMLINDGGDKNFEVPMND